MRISVSSYATSGQTFSIFFSIRLSFQKINWTGLLHFVFYFVPEVVVKRITIWGWWAPFYVLNKPFVQFFLWEILNNIDTMWWCTNLIIIQVLLFIIRLISKRSSFFKCLLYVLEMTFKPLSFIKNSIVAPFYVTSRNHYLFDCLLVGWKRRLIWLPLLSNSQAPLFWEFKGTSKVKPFSSCIHIF